MILFFIITTAVALVAAGAALWIALDARDTARLTGGIVDDLVDALVVDEGDEDVESADVVPVGSDAPVLWAPVGETEVFTPLRVLGSIPAADPRHRSTGADTIPEA